PGLASRRKVAAWCHKRGGCVGRPFTHRAGRCLADSCFTIKPQSWSRLSHSLAFAIHPEDRFSLHFIDSPDSGWFTKKRVLFEEIDPLRFNLSAAPARRYISTVRSNAMSLALMSVKGRGASKPRASGMSRIRITLRNVGPSRCDLGGSMITTSLIDGSSK